MSEWRPADLLTLSDERDRYLTRITAAEQAGFDRGWNAGYEQARADTLAELAYAQRLACDHVARVQSHEPYRRLLARRWSPPSWKGRLPAAAARMDNAALRRWLASRPRKGDYPGQAAAR